jgi:hypothetical protein
MKRFLWVIALLLPIAAQRTYADSVTTFFAQATISFTTNCCGGDNQDSTFTGPGVNLTAAGDVSCFWCGDATVFLVPGSMLTPNISHGGVDFVYVTGVLVFDGKAQVVDPNDSGLFVTGITALRSFRFPTNGRTITVTIPAMLDGPIRGQTGEGPTLHQFDLQIPPGKLVLTFDFIRDGSSPYYQFTNGVFTTVPEPGTLGLMASGLAGIVGAALRKRRR